MSQVNKKHQSGNFFRSTLALERNLLKCLLLHLEQSEMVMAFFPHHSCLFHPYDITFTNKTFCPACTVWLLSTASRSRVALFSRIFHAFTFSSNILATSLFLFRAQQISSLFALKIANGNASVCPQETSKKATMQRDGHRIYFLSWLKCLLKIVKIIHVSFDLCGCVCVQFFLIRLLAWKMFTKTGMLKYFSEGKHKFELRKTRTQSGSIFFFYARFYVMFQFFSLACELAQYYTELQCPIRWKEVKIIGR